MRICYLPSDFDGPGCYRCLFPGRLLKERGHQTVMPPHKRSELADGREQIMYHGPLGEGSPISILPAYPYADLWVLQQRFERFWAEGGIEALRKQGIAVIGEVDDNYLELPPSNPAFVGTHPYQRSDGSIVNRAQRRRAKRLTGGRVGATPNDRNRFWMVEGLRAMDALSVSTPYLAELYSGFNENIRVLRNRLDWQMWSDVTPQYEVERRLRIGYMGSYKFHGADLAVIRDVLPEVLRRNPQVDFVTTNEETHDYLRVPKDRRVTTGGVDFRSMRLPEITAVMDIGLVPLLDNGLNQGKSHLKGMEYNACGIPFVATPTESYRFWTREGVNGFLADSGSEWSRHLETLIRDHDVRRAMGSYARRIAEAESLQHHVGEWEDFYSSVVGDELGSLVRGALQRRAIQKRKELTALARLVQARKPKVVVEIGSAHGGTFWLWCRLAHPEALLVSIDLPDADFGGTVKDPYGERNYERMLSYKLPGQEAHLLKANSQHESTRAKLQEILNGRSIDFLMIDGDHAYQGVKRDFELYSPLVDGIVAFHDIVQHTNGLSEVDRLWREVGPGLELVDRLDTSRHTAGQWGGIGVLEVSREREELAA